MSDAIQGFEQLERRLMSLGDATKIKRLAKAGVVAGQRVVVKAIKAQIPGSYKEVRKAVGQSFKRLKKGEDAGSVSAKLGIAVGKKQISKEEQKAIMRQRRAAGKKGVGISARNALWLVVGTKFMKRAPPLAGVVQRGVAASATDAANKIKQNIADGLHRVAKG